MKQTFGQRRQPVQTQFQTLNLWIIGCAYCIAAGWLLSLFAALNLIGYCCVVAVAITIAATKLGRQKLSCVVFQIQKAARKRWRRPRIRALPLLFYIAALLALIGGVIHAPNNYDALTYRLPRTLHWWSTGSWHWITTNDGRMNFSAEGFEWLIMPLFVFTKSDRLIFLLNWIPYLFMPVLIFSVFRQLGVSARVAWVWMWILPLSYCYILQAGSIGNDGIGALFLLAGLHFALRARRLGLIEDLWLALLGAAMASGIKAINLPLYLPIAVVAFPLVLRLRARPLASAMIIAVALVVSFLPTAILNQHYTGSWTGDPLDLERCQIKSPSVAFVGNAIELADENLAPPILPFARKLETKIWEKFPQRIRERLAQSFPRFVFHFGELAQEEATGLGLGTMVILLVTVACLIITRTGRHYQLGAALWTGIAAWIALFAFMIKSGIGYTSARLLAAYYPLLIIPLLIFPANHRLARSKLWVRFVTVCASLALIPLLLTPSRPLLPVRSALNHLLAKHPHNRQLARAAEVYAVYAARNDILAPMRQALPSSATKVGFISGTDDTELSLWRPFGSRTLQNVTNANAIATSGLQWLVVKPAAVESQTGLPFETWTTTNNLQIVSFTSITEKAGVGAEKWCLVHGPQIR